MTTEEMKKFESGYNEGFLYAAQVVASEVIRLINTHRWMLPSDKTQAVAQIKLSTRAILEHRKLVPTTYQVIRGAEDVPLNFELRK